MNILKIKTESYKVKYCTINDVRTEFTNYIFYNPFPARNFPLEHVYEYIEYKLSDGAVTIQYIEPFRAFHQKLERPHPAKEIIADLSKKYQYNISNIIADNLFTKFNNILLYAQHDREITLQMY